MEILVAEAAIQAAHPKATQAVVPKATQAAPVVIPAILAATLAVLAATLAVLAAIPVCLAVTPEHREGIPARIKTRRHRKVRQPR
jgi:hypothetical protein